MYPDATHSSGDGQRGAYIGIRVGGGDDDSPRVKSSSRNAGKKNSISRNALSSESEIGDRVQKPWQ